LSPVLVGMEDDSMEEGVTKTEKDLAGDDGYTCKNDDLFGYCMDLDDPYPLVLESDKESV
jgi:hypothetical protein